MIARSEHALLRVLLLFHELLKLLLHLNAFEFKWIDKCFLLQLLVKGLVGARWVVEHVADGGSDRENDEVAVNKALKESDVLVFLSDIVHDVAHLVVVVLDLGGEALNVAEILLFLLFFLFLIVLWLLINFHLLILVDLVLLGHEAVDVELHDSVNVGLSI